MNSRKVLVLCGLGGVGKTTLSAALGIREASEGKKVCVITTDPSRRLAYALGIETTTFEPQNITPRLAELEKQIKGEFWAVVPTPEQTFEAVVEQFLKNPATAEKLKKNSIYKMILKDFSGAHEYMVLFRFLQIFESGQFDLIILDTPPNRNVLTFLRAPAFIRQFYEEKIIRFILQSTHTLAWGSQKILSLLEKLTGKGFVSELLEFCGILFELQGGFLKAMDQIAAVFESEILSFLFVTRVDEPLSKELLQLLEFIRSKNYCFDGVFLNRCLSQIKTRTNLPEDLQESADLLKHLIATEADQVENISRILSEIHDMPNRRSQFVFPVPEMTRDIRTLEDLVRVAFAMDPKHQSMANR